MNKKELLNLIENCKKEDVFYNLKINGLNSLETGALLQELIREKELQFQIEIIDGNYKYEVVDPSKKFLKREGQWKRSLSDKVMKYIKDLK